MTISVIFLSKIIIFGIKPKSSRTILGRRGLRVTTEIKRGFFFNIDFIRGV